MLNVELFKSAREGATK